MQLQVHCQTDIGLRRDSNEDSFLIDEALGLYIVADGMGGHSGGEVASAMAVQIIRDVVLKSRADQRKPDYRNVLTEAYREASRRIYDRSHGESPELRGMGTTVVAALVVGDTLYVGNVGDSRAYLFSQARLWQITEDHSLVNEQLRAGILAEKDVATFTAKNVITRSVGFEREVSCDVIEREMQPGEKYLICSDGLSGLVDDAVIASILAQGTPEQNVSKCIDQAKRNGGDDNVTVLVISTNR